MLKKMNDNDLNYLIPTQYKIFLQFPQCLLIDFLSNSVQSKFLH